MFNIKSQTATGNNILQAGRDINNYYSHQDEKMKELIEAYKEEQKSNPSFNKIIEELDYYLNPVKAEEQNVIGLEQKLINGQFDEYIEYAMAMKDIFWRNVERNRFSKAAQQIFLYIMADVHILFKHKIYPLLSNNNDHELIMSKIYDEIIYVLLQKLGENILDIYADSISGIIFFLTGNCHIKWSKK